MPLIKISKKLFTTAKQSRKEKGPFGVALGAATAAKSNKALLKHLHSKPKTRQKVPNV